MQQTTGIFLKVFIFGSLAAVASASSVGTFGSGVTVSGSGQAQDDTGIVANLFNLSDPNSAGNTVSAAGVVNVLGEDGQIYSFAQNASGSAGASASLGKLGVSASATASSTPQSYFYDNDGTASVDNNYRATGVGDAFAYWTDTILIQGTGPVDLQFTASAYGSANMTFADWDSAVFSTALCVNTTPAYYGCDLRLGVTGAGSDTQTLFDVDPGTRILLTGTLNAHASANAGFISGFGYTGQTSASVQASHTALFDIDVLTPGASYVSASGTVYNATESPEAGTIALFGIGLAAVALARVRKIPRPQ